MIHSEVFPQKHMGNPIYSSFRSASSPTSPSKRTTSCKGRLVKSSYRESFKKVRNDKNSVESVGEKSSRRPSVVQQELNKQKPKLDTKLYPNYTDMPRMWAEVSDTQKQ